MAVDQKKRFLLLYGSQTGQAQAIAEDICKKAQKRGFIPELHCMSQSDKNFNLEKESLVVIVVSTTGDGDAPDTVSRFWRKLKRKTQPPDLFKNLKYGLLGLGDSNYTNFCNMGKVLNMRLLELGAQPFCETGYADDGVGLELVVEPWIENLWPALESVFNLSYQDKTSQTNTPVAVVNDGVSPQTIVTDEVSPTRGPSIVATKVPLTVKTPEIPVLTSNIKTNGTSIQPVTTTVHDEVQIAIVSDLSDTVNTLLNLEYTDSSDTIVDFSIFETTMRGSSDEAWKNQHIIVPSTQPSYLNVELKEDMTMSYDFSFCESVQGSTMFQSLVTMATISDRRVLTSLDAQKTTLELELSWQVTMVNNRDDIESDSKSSVLSYEPGDALCFICPNDSLEVDYLLKRLNLQSLSWFSMNITIIPNSKKRNPMIPKHIPTHCTVHQYFTHCADIRAVPSKALLLMLSEFCSQDEERQRLRWFCCRQGSQDYMRLILEPHIDILDLLHCFPSCQPPLSRLIELLPRLQPRHYSVASSPLTCQNKMRIAFNIIELPKRSWKQDLRKGLCTSWLDRLSHDHTSRIPIYPRLKNPFHLPPNPSTPIIMIGPGTGVAPFIGFLQHREALKASGVEIGEAWLFFGCRDPDKDYLYKSEIEGFLASGNLTHLHVSFSRLSEERYVQEDHVKYVQENMRRHWELLGQWVMEECSVTYVCGDAQNMRKNIYEAMLDVIHKYNSSKGLTNQTSSIEILKSLQEDCRYIVDLWS